MQEYPMEDDLDAVLKWFGKEAHGIVCSENNQMDEKQKETEFGSESEQLEGTEEQCSKSESNVATSLECRTQKLRNQFCTSIRDGTDIVEAAIRVEPLAKSLMGELRIKVEKMKKKFL